MNTTELLKELKKPFDEENIEFKVGATNQDKTMGLALPYVDSRAIQNRLDEVIGVNNWKVKYRELHDAFLCTLSLRINNEWIDKEDGAQGTDYESLKGGISSAFKRAASSGWGIGRYIYKAIPQWTPIVQKGRSYSFAMNPILEFKEPLKKEETKIEQPIKETKPKRSKEDLVMMAKNLEIKFGKYSGSTLGHIFKTDKAYINYLNTNSNNTTILEACRILSS